MKTVYTYYKNSNTNELIMKQEFTETEIKNIPIYYYNNKRLLIEDPDLIGFVDISEKKFNRECKKQNQ